MKLYSLTLKQNERFDVTLAMLIRAPNSVAARRLAQTSGEASDEGGAAWLDPKQTTCRQVPQTGAPGVVLVSKKNG